MPKIGRFPRKEVFFFSLFNLASMVGLSWGLLKEGSTVLMTRGLRGITSPDRFLNASLRVVFVCWILSIFSRAELASERGIFFRMAVPISMFLLIGSSKLFLLNSERFMVDFLVRSCFGILGSISIIVCNGKLTAFDLRLNWDDGTSFLGGRMGVKVLRLSFLGSFIMGEEHFELLTFSTVFNFVTSKTGISPFPLACEHSQKIKFNLFYHN